MILLGLVARNRRYSQLHPLQRAGEREQLALAACQNAAEKNHRAAGAGDLAKTFDQLALARGIEELTGKRHRYARSLQHGGGGREQAIIRKRHEAAAVDVLHSVEMLALDPERAADTAVVLHAVVERPVMDLEIV